MSVVGAGMIASESLHVASTVNDTSEISELPAEQRTAPAIDAEMLATLLHVASFHARRVARTLRLSAADRQDVEQGIVLTVLERQRYFDAARGSWRAFVDLVARQAAQQAADSLMVAYRRAGPSLDMKADQPVGMFETALPPKIDPSEAAALRLSLGRFLAELPEGLAIVARLAFVEEGDYATAQQRSGLSLREFHRRLREVRYRLISLGVIRRPARPRGTIGGVDRY